jgi:hypothetical protein
VTALAALSEREIWRAYGSDAAAAEEMPEVAVRTEACACGGTLGVAIESPVLILRAVVAHQGTALHRAWWAWIEARV